MLLDHVRGPLYFLQNTHVLFLDDTEKDGYVICSFLPLNSVPPSWFRVCYLYLPFVVVISIVGIILLRCIFSLLL